MGQFEVVDPTAPGDDPLDARFHARRRRIDRATRCEPGRRLATSRRASQHRPVASTWRSLLSTAAAFAHCRRRRQVTTSWWPAAGLFFGVLGVAQLAVRRRCSFAADTTACCLAGIWGTVGVILMYVASRTVGLPVTPPVPFHGGRWVDRSGGGAQWRQARRTARRVHAGRPRWCSSSRCSACCRADRGSRTVNRLMWIGLALWGASVVACRPVTDSDRAAGRRRAEPDRRSPTTTGRRSGASCGSSPSSSCCCSFAASSSSRSASAVRQHGADVDLPAPCS